MLFLMVRNYKIEHKSQRNSVFWGGDFLKTYGGIKKSPVEGRGNLMFSQRNNPYCELLSIYTANISEFLIRRIKFFPIFEKNELRYEKNLRTRFRNKLDRMGGGECR